MPLAGELTLKQSRLVDAVVLGQAETITQAGQIAGYSHRETASQALRIPTVQREIARRQAEKRDTARSIRKRALAKSSVALEEETDLGRLMGTAKIAADIEAALPEEQESSQDDMAPRAYHLLLRMLVAGIRIGIKAPHTLELMTERMLAAGDAVAQQATMPQRGSR